mmetsp:Transcript_4471/g.6528  ORF Transcript_4471/g.6528 Transcript_4471/m.6528 type:complete len:86 (+) Transcript_4471:401-658(+)
MLVITNLAPVTPVNVKNIPMRKIKRLLTTIITNNRIKDTSHRHGTNGLPNNALLRVAPHHPLHPEIDPVSTTFLMESISKQSSYA